MLMDTLSFVMALCVANHDDVTTPVLGRETRLLAANPCYYSQNGYGTRCASPHSMQGWAPCNLLA